GSRLSLAPALVPPGLGGTTGPGPPGCAPGEPAAGPREGAGPAPRREAGRGPGRRRRPVAGEAVRGSTERVKGRWRGRPAVGSEHVQIATASILRASVTGILHLPPPAARHPWTPEGCLVGVLAVGHTHLVRKRLASETACTCWRQPGRPANAVTQDLTKKWESSRIPPWKRLGIMAAKKLRRARLSQELCERLSRHQITTCQDFLCLSFLELMKVTGQSYYDVRKLLCKVSRACAPKMQTAYEMKLRKSDNPSSAFLSTTLHSLDKVLHGG
uniref:XRCC3/RAD51 homolog 2 helix-hairpin-helix domain-containing protein n=1 Tax=Strigops habroptila TaxID=2489341 RepID=A0A672V6Y7_STRHB